jgi:hypothetical protein
VHHPAGEFIDDDDLIVLHHVVLVAMKQVVRPQRRIELMHEVDVGRLVQACALGEQADAGEDFLGFLVTGFRQQDLVILLVDEEVSRRIGLVRLFLLLLPRQQRRHLVHPVVDLGAVLGLAGNDQRRARFVDQDRVHLVDDRVGQASLESLLDVHRHVVAQVVETELVVRAVRDVCRVRGALVRGLPSAGCSRRPSIRGTRRSCPSTRRRGAPGNR